MISLSDFSSSLSNSDAVAARSANCLAARRNSSKNGESTESKSSFSSIWDEFAELVEAREP